MHSSNFLHLAEKHIGEKYILGSKAELSNPDFSGPWDCAEFITYIVYWVTKSVYGYRDNEAYTGYWAEDTDNKLLEEISVKDAIKTNGSILLRVPRKSRNGHIAFSDGDGGTIEAMSKRWGVCKGNALSANRDWDYGILIPGIKYL